MILTLVENFEIQGKKKLQKKLALFFIFLVPSVEVKKRMKVDITETKMMCFDNFL